MNDADSTRGGVVMRSTWMMAPFVALILVACSGEAPSTEAEPTLEQGAPVAKVISATGVVVPAQWATLSMPTGGIAEAPGVEVGDEVEQGEVLVALSGRDQAESALAAARLERLLSRQTLTTLREQAGMARAQAERELASARDALRLADNKRQNQQQGHRASTGFIEGAEAIKTQLIFSNMQMGIEFHFPANYSQVAQNRSRHTNLKADSIDIDNHRIRADGIDNPFYSGNHFLLLFGFSSMSSFK